MASDSIRWGILGTGSIARVFATDLPQSRTGRAVAVGSRSQASADAFGEKFGIARRHGSYEALLADDQVDAIYLTLPHPMHARWTIAALRAGKHVLCEKPFTLNAAETMAVLEEADLAKRLVMEAFMYRCHPQTRRIVELLGDKAIGELRVIQSTFAFNAGFNPESRLYANSLGGGGIMDVGCYAVSMARLAAGAAVGKAFADPTHVSGTAHLGKTGVDEWAVGTLKFDGGIVATVATGVGVTQENVVRLFGSEGSITVPKPWISGRGGDASGLILLQKSGQAVQEIAVPATGTSYSMEADALGDAIGDASKGVLPPAMTPLDTLGNMRTLDRWREAVGLEYETEAPKTFPRVTITGRPLVVAPDKPMKYATVPGLALPVSRLVLGCDNQANFPHAVVMFDDFYNKGGNAFDTAYIYGNGRMERVLGAWIKLRGVRDQVNVIVKGAHTPQCDPTNLRRQLKESLQRLQIDSADFYLMHRDNPDVPVGEFVDVLDEEARAGRIKVFGGSNWTLARVQAANDYARRNGRRGFGVVSNNLSLARMVDPVWDGCVSASDPASRAWLGEHQLAVLAWSSQARGFFLPGRAEPGKVDDAELARCWYSDDNFRRLERAKELAGEKNVSPINIALAYVLAQPFPTFALIGPRQLGETRTSLPGLDVTLTPAEMMYLNLEAQTY